MGFVEIYIIVLFFIGFSASMYYTGADEIPENDLPVFVNFIIRWTFCLPMVGRIFGWW